MRCDVKVGASKPQVLNLSGGHISRGGVGKTREFNYFLSHLQLGFKEIIKALF